LDVINTLLHSVCLTQFPVIVLYMHNVTAPHVHMSDKACFYGTRDQLPLLPHPSISVVCVCVCVCVCDVPDQLSGFNHIMY